MAALARSDLGLEPRGSSRAAPPRPRRRRLSPARAGVTARPDRAVHEQRGAAAGSDLEHRDVLSNAAERPLDASARGLVGFVAQRQR